MRRLTLFLAALPLGFAPLPKPKTPPARGELKSLQGEWLAVRWSTSSDEKIRIGGRWLQGIETTRKEAGDGTVFVFEGATVRLRKGRSEKRLWSLKAGPAAAPRRLSLAPAGGGPARPAIYSLQGDTLTICYPEAGGARPTAFNDRDQWMLVLRRKDR